MVSKQSVNTLYPHALKQLLDYRQLCLKMKITILILIICETLTTWISILQWIK
jgi:hypothetical protein